MLFRSHTRLPSLFIDDDPLHVPADHRDWFRFQRAYDTARQLVTAEETFGRRLEQPLLDGERRFSGIDAMP